MTQSELFGFAALTACSVHGVSGEGTASIAIQV